MSSQEDIHPDSSPDTPSSAANSKDAFFDPKPQPKVIRVLTVLAYVLSVSMAAILLSIYYIFMWDGRPHLGARVSGPDFGMDNLSSSASEFQSKIVNHYRLPNNSVIIFHGKGNETSPMMGKVAEYYEKEKNDASGSLLYFTTLKENFTSDYGSSTEMHQQFIAVESEQLRAYTTSASPADENITDSSDYDSIEDLGKTSPFIKKLMGNYEGDY